jgi:NAD(P)H-hydrate epimerase
MGVAVDADYSVTFGLPKIGNLLYPGYELGGKLFISHISFSPTIYSDDGLKIEINRPLKLPPRSKTGHKGDFGDVLFIAGAASYLGAPYFAAHSFLKAGGGYAHLATPASIAPFIASKVSELVIEPQKETAAGSLSLENKEGLLELSDRVDMIIIGPGLSLEPETQQLARELTVEIDKPILIDGDGITALCGDLQILKNRPDETILTPHLGEMSRITGLEIADIDTHKIDILQRTTRELNTAIILKGAHSLIGYPDQRVFINISGNSGMATAGSGDVLTGTIAAMFGLGLSIQEALRQGVFIHGLAGGLAAEAIGEDGITAQDILDNLPRAVRLVREAPDQTLLARFGGAHLI